MYGREGRDRADGDPLPRDGRLGNRQARYEESPPQGVGFRLLTNPRFFRGFVLSEALSDDRKRLIAA